MASDVTASKRHIAPLTSLRFVAALMVLWHHYWAFEAGYAGVGFFYVLSGYVLAYNYAGQVNSSAERCSFWFRRFARIYPTYLLTFAFALPLGSPILDTIPSIPMLQSWSPFEGHYYAANAPAWSISNEAFFYALFPLLIGLRGRSLLIWSATLVCLALIWTIALPAFAFDTIVPWLGFDTVPTRYAFYIFPPVRLLEFALGIWLAGLANRPAGLGYEAGAITLAVASILALPLFPPAYQGALFFIPAAVTLVYVFARSTGPIARLLNNRWLVLLGDASFMLYMIHWPLARYLGTDLWVAALAVALSILLYLSFERPVQKWVLRVRQRALDVKLAKERVEVGY